MSLPTLVCLKSAVNNKYMRYRHENDRYHGCFEASAESVMDPYALFEIEKAKTVDGLIHIKSRYNNKYLVRWSPSNDFFAASGQAPDENQSSWRCTLIKPVPLEGNKIQLAPVSPVNSCLFAGLKDGVDPGEIFTVVDWEAIFKLPRRVAFKGLIDGKYLGAAETGDRQPGFQFSFTDINNRKVANQIFPNPDGTIYIKSEYYGKFWGLGPNNWIVGTQVDPRGSNDNTSAMFKLCASDLNKVALINIKAPLCYCKAYTINDSIMFLSAAINDADEFTWVDFVDLDNS